MAPETPANTGVYGAICPPKDSIAKKSDCLSYLSNWSFSNCVRGNINPCITD